MTLCGKRGYGRKRAVCVTDRFMGQGKVYNGNGSLVGNRLSFLFLCAALAVEVWVPRGRMGAE